MSRHCTEQLILLSLIAPGALLLAELRQPYIACTSSGAPLEGGYGRCGVTSENLR